MNILKSAEETVSAVREKTDSCILFLSCGKDSLVTLDLIYPRFTRIVCVYMYFVDGLAHIERWLRWVQARYPKVELVRLPHWSLSYILKSGLYSVPNPDVRLTRLSDVVACARRQTGLRYVFLGMKRSDSMNRLLMLDRMRDTCHIAKDMCYPLAEWTQKDVLSYMRQHRLPQPVRYSLKASGGIGFNADCLLWMEEHEPADLKKIYSVFPLCERILWEHKQKTSETE